MRCVVDIPDDLPPRVVAYQTRALVEFVTAQNQWIMSTKRLPSVYESGVRFRIEPWADRCQFYAHWDVVLEQGWADCKSIGAALLAQRRLEDPGRTYAPFIYWREHETDPLHGQLGAPGRVLVLHVDVMHPDGRIEDASRLLRQ